ncbi:sugar transferase [Dorea longicatena]|uniref:Sugar transferase n=1 Tax=Dorea longicatena TaxID=88431 RepID=A0A414T1H0_9FIRM|nr:sugar transferase [Dorea longicatena]RHG28042.1 sugar transferase [Dorea longicatena]
MLKGKNGFYNRYVKRIIDIICALLAIMVFWWLYLIVAVLVRIKLGSPIIFKQERPGKIDKKTGKETIFNLYKFRTMTDKRDVEGNLLPDDVRLTKFGRILRSTSLDELPEAFNILKGDMSVIGPRPLLVEYLPYYTKEEHHRHDVRPGLSGWAQINGRNAIDSWEQRFQYDLEYVKNVSFAFDIKVVLKTIEKVLKRSDIQVGKQIKAGRLDTARGNKNENINS